LKIELIKMALMIMRTVKMNFIKFLVENGDDSLENQISFQKSINTPKNTNLARVQALLYKKEIEILNNIPLVKKVFYFV